MNDFVERCRREWCRLAVPAAIADDMAAELEADLAEAKADGVSAQELLGRDPRAFAASWAAERGVVPAGWPWFGFHAGQRVLVGAGALLSVAAIAAGTVLLASPTDHTSALPLPPPVVVVRELPVATTYDTSTVGGVPVQTPVHFAAATDNSRQTLAWSLVIAGLAAFGLSVLYRWRGVQVRRRTS